MTWPEVALAFVNVVQVVALAWIATKAHATKREVERVNGDIQELIEELRGSTDPVIADFIRRRYGRGVTTD